MPVPLPETGARLDRVVEVIPVTAGRNNPALGLYSVRQVGDPDTRPDPDPGSAIQLPRVTALGPPVTQWLARPFRVQEFNPSDMEDQWILRWPPMSILDTLRQFGPLTGINVPGTVHYWWGIAGVFPAQMAIRIGTASVSVRRIYPYDFHPLRRNVASYVPNDPAGSMEFISEQRQDADGSAYWEPTYASSAIGYNLAALGSTYLEIELATPIPKGTARAIGGNEWDPDTGLVVPATILPNGLPTIERGRGKRAFCQLLDSGAGAVSERDAVGSTAATEQQIAEVRNYLFRGSPAGVSDIIADGIVESTVLEVEPIGRGRFSRVTAERRYTATFAARET